MLSLIPPAGELCLLPLNEAAKYTPYTAAFLRQLARQRKLKAVKLGRDWVVAVDDLRAFLHDQQSRHEQALLALRCAEGGLL